MSSGLHGDILVKAENVAKPCTQEENVKQPIICKAYKA